MLPSIRSLQRLCLRLHNRISLREQRRLGGSSTWQTIERARLRRPRVNLLTFSTLDLTEIRLNHCPDVRAKRGYTLLIET